METAKILECAKWLKQDAQSCQKHLDCAEIVIKLLEEKERHIKALNRIKKLTYSCDPFYGAACFIDIREEIKEALDPTL